MIAIAALLVALASWGLLIYQRDGDSDVAAVGADSGLSVEFGKLSEVLETLQRRHIDRENMDAESLADGAIRGLLDALGDPHAAYLTAEQYAITADDFSVLALERSPCKDPPQVAHHNGGKRSLAP